MDNDRLSDITKRFEIVTDGELAPQSVDYALRRLRPVLARIQRPVLSARLKLVDSMRPANPRPCRAQILIDVDGDLLRAEVADETMVAAIDALKDRLKDQLTRLADRKSEARSHSSGFQTGVRRRAEPSGRRSIYYHLAASERELRRRKSVSVVPTTVEEAVADMEQLDHDFYLFREAATGADALVVRRDDGSYGLFRLRSSPEDPARLEGVEIYDSVPPLLSVDEAVDRIGITGERCFFFENVTTRRGNVVYRRYDGHYGLISPAEPDDGNGL